MKTGLHHKATLQEAEKFEIRGVDFKIEPEERSH